MSAHVLAFALAIALSVSPPPPSPAPPGHVAASAVDNATELTAVTAGVKIAQSQATDPALLEDEYTRADLCGTEAGLHMNADCSGYAATASPPECEGLDPVPPVWHRHRNSPADPWQRWTLALGWTCPQDAVPVLSEADFRRLPIAPSPITIQPDRVDVFVNMPTIVYTDPVVQSFTTTLLGLPVEVEATPTRFSWDFGDGSDPIITTSPGHPYPDHDVAYPYPAEGTFTITLTTEFTGRYRLAGATTWLPVVGVATTTTTAGPLMPEEHHTHLVDTNCIENPHGPWCDT